MRTKNRDEMGCVVLLALLVLAGCSMGRILPATSAASKVEATKAPTVTEHVVEWYGPIPVAPIAPVAPTPPAPTVHLCAPNAPVLGLVARLWDVAWDFGARSVAQAAAAQGVGATGEAVKVAKLTAPVARVPEAGGPSAAGGAAKGVSISSGLEGSAMWILFGLGGVCIVAGAFLALVLKMLKPGAVIGGCGLGIVALGVVAEKYPWAFLVGLILGALVVAYVLWTTHGAATAAAATSSALTSTVAGVQAARTAAPTSFVALLDTALGLAQSTADKDHIKALKTTPAVAAVTASAADGLSKVPTAATAAAAPTNQAPAPAPASTN